MLPKPAVKVLLNLASIAIDALVRGGTLAVGAERRDGATEIAVRAAGPRVAFDGNIGKALDGSLPVRELSGPDGTRAHDPPARRGARWRRPIRTFGRSAGDGGRAAGSHRLMALRRAQDELVHASCLPRTGTSARCR
jgi:hypothetical protein